MNIVILTRKNNSRMPGHRYARAFESMGHWVEVHDTTEDKQNLELHHNEHDINFVLWDDNAEYQSYPHILNCPNLYLAIDTSVEKGGRCQMQSKNMDHVFYAQMAQSNNFPSGTFLPNAHDSIISKFNWKPWDKRTLFAGSVGDFFNRDDRKEFREKVEQKFQHYVEFNNSVPFEKLDEFYGNCKVCINHNHYKDCNLRIFEGCAAGSLLLVNPNCDNNGLSQLGFVNGENCVHYWDTRSCLDTLQDLFMDQDCEYLAKIAQAGQHLVYSKHTYVHRCQKVLEYYAKIS